MTVASTAAGAAPAATPGVDTDEQAALRQSVAALLEKKSDSAAVRDAMTSADGFDPALWSTLVEQIGAAALSIPEEHDGAGATFIETHLVCEELGRRLTPSPMLGSAVLAAQAVLASGDAEAAARLLPSIAAGEQVALCWAGSGGWSIPGVRADSPANAASAADARSATLTGTAHHVLGADTASTLLVVAVSGDSVGLFELPADADGVVVTRVPVMDPTRTLARVEFSGATATAITTRNSFLSRLRTAGWAAISAEQIGAARAILDATVQYTQERKQFGRVIGSFQALKHRMADMYVKVETARSLSYSAAAQVAHAQAVDSEQGAGPESDAAAYAAEVEAAAAKVYSSEALQWITGEAIQLHGGVGITWEYDAHLYFKRAHGTAQLLGQPHELLSALETAAGL